MTKVILNLRSNYFLQNFDDESEVGDGAKVTEVIGVCTRILENRDNCSNFKGRWNSARDVRELMAVIGGIRELLGVLTKGVGRGSNCQGLDLRITL